MEEERFEQVETEEEEEGYPYPVRTIQVRAGIDEDGGGVEIFVRFDGESPEICLQAVREILKEINGRKEERSRFGQEVV